MPQTVVSAGNILWGTALASQLLHLIAPEHIQRSDKCDDSIAQQLNTRSTKGQ
ncbi:hypothetical protein LSAT2_010170 [Lamellibrachia satsuma]|nr:hypothetical protein LSAT2_010170 [Lamellibrachia satsuma]